MCKWIKSGNQRIDPCMRNNLKWPEDRGYKVLACCCGHDKYEYTIVAKKYGQIIEMDTGIIIPRKRKFYCRDSEGHFYIPEIEMWRYIGFVLFNNDELHVPKELINLWIRDLKRRSKILEKT